MKYAGSDSFFKAQRNNNLMAVYRQLIGSAKEICLMDVYEQVVNFPAERFWVSEERAAVVIAAMMKGDKLLYMRKTKREMFYEIYRRAQIIAKKNPEMTPLELATIVVRQPAPKFYMSPGSARIYIMEVRKKWYEERRKKLKHLFY